VYVVPLLNYRKHRKYRSVGVSPLFLRKEARSPPGYVSPFRLCSCMKPFTAMEVVAPEELAHAHPLDQPPSREPQLGLSPELDARPARAFVVGDAKVLLEEIRGRAEALAGQDGTSARRRLLAKALALCNSQMAVLQTIQGDLLRARQFRDVEQLDRMLERLTRRLAVLLEAHRAEYAVLPTIQVRIG
jgi:hypothetical protein